jgi:hypothetical protein
MNNDSTATTTSAVVQGHPAPTLVSRERGNTARENQRDWEAMRWVARFRFVDVKVLAVHLGVSRQQTGVRIRRLERAGLLTRNGTPGGTAGWTVSVTARGLRAIGLPPRRPARTDLQREHELAVAWLVTRLEARDDGSAVYTERECRARERTTGIRHSADMQEPRDRASKRWPDLILEHSDGRRLVIEFERTLKGATRLRRIVDGYRGAHWFDEVWLLCANAAIARAVAVAVRSDAHPLPGFPAPVIDPDQPTIKLAPWPGLQPTAKQAIQSAIEQAYPPPRHLVRPPGR